MERRPPSPRIDQVVCRERISGELINSDLTVDATFGAGSGPFGPDPSTAAQRLAHIYFSTLPRLSWGLTRARTPGAPPDNRGSSEETRLCLILAPFVSLITLGPPRTEATPTGATVTYPVTGGLLSRRPSTGALIFEVAVAPGRTTLAVRVRDFSSRLAGDCSPRWRRALYKGTQWLVHRVLVTRFLRRAGRDFVRAAG
jgi:hypothetical protein